MFSLYKQFSTIIVPNCGPTSSMIRHCIAHLMSCANSANTRLQYHKYQTNLRPESPLNYIWACCLSLCHTGNLCIEPLIWLVYDPAHHRTWPQNTLMWTDIWFWDSIEWSLTGLTQIRANNEWTVVWALGLSTGSCAPDVWSERSVIRGQAVAHYAINL